MRQFKKYLVNSLGNYLFFVPLVVLFTPSLRSWHGLLEYAQAAVPVTLIGSYAYVLFLKHFWYPLCREEF